MNMTYDVGNASLGLGQAYKYLDLKSKSWVGTGIQISRFKIQVLGWDRHTNI
jgi:hypothetical protein